MRELIEGCEGKRLVEGRGVRAVVDVVTKAAAGENRGEPEFVGWPHAVPREAVDVVPIRVSHFRACDRTGAVFVAVVNGEEDVDAIVAVPIVPGVFKVAAVFQPPNNHSDFGSRLAASAGVEVSIRWIQLAAGSHQKTGTDLAPLLGEKELITRIANKDQCLFTNHRHLGLQSYCCAIICPYVLGGTLRSNGNRDCGGDGFVVHR